MSVQETMDSITTTEQQSTDGANTPEAGQQQSTTEQPQGDQVEGGQQQEQPGDKPVKKPGVQSRIDELTRARHQAEREAAYWREQAAKSQPSSTDAQKPTKADFPDDEAYFEALADFKAEQKVQQFSQQTQAERAQEADAKQTATRFDLYRERVTQSAEAMPDYHEVVGQSEVPAAPHVLESILDSDVGPQLAYHLAQNPDVAERLNGMTPVQAARELGRLEEKLSQPKAGAATPTAKRTTNAPAPITPVRGGSGQFTKAPEAMSDAEWYASQRK